MRSSHVLVLWRAHHFVAGHGLAEEEALAEVAAETLEDLQLVLTFDAFGDNVEVQDVGDGYDRRDEGGACEAAGLNRAPRPIGEVCTHELCACDVDCDAVECMAV